MSLLRLEPGRPWPWLATLLLRRCGGAGSLLSGNAQLYMSADFPRQVYGEIKQLFPAGTVETQVARPVVFGPEPSAMDPAVRLVHTPTGIEASCSDFPSQTENYIAAAIRLRIACDKHAA